jgi:uncharacterized protein YcfJ
LSHLRFFYDGSVFVKKIIFLAVAFGVGATALAQSEEYGRVISSSPITQAVSRQQQVCNGQPSSYSAPKSGAGAIMGAIAGGAIGNSIGKGNGRALATGVGIVGGALFGDQVEGQGQAQPCSMQTFTDYQTVGYMVRYEYNGKQYSAQFPSDPGQYVRLQVVPMNGR